MVRMVNGLHILSNKNKYQANTIHAMAERRWGQVVGELGVALHVSSPAEVVVEHGDEVGLWERGDTRGTSLPRQVAGDTNSASRPSTAPPWTSRHQAVWPPPAPSEWWEGRNRCRVPLAHGQDGLGITKREGWTPRVRAAKPVASQSRWRWRNALAQKRFVLALAN
jgi:hypothetical protein